MRSDIWSTNYKRRSYSFTSKRGGTFELQVVNLDVRFRLFYNASGILSSSQLIAKGNNLQTLKELVTAIEHDVDKDQIMRNFKTLSIYNLLN